MPDAGNFDQDRNPRDNRDWGDSFAALPLETPDAGGWQRVQARLPAASPRARIRLPVRAAAAASLVLAAGLGWRMLPMAGPETHAPIPGPSATPVSTQTATATTTVAAPATAEQARPAADTATAVRDKPHRIPPSQHPIRTAAEPVGSTRMAKAKAQAHATPAASSLEPLYAQSAQLEALLAMARDDRVASGTTAALSDTLDAQVATIDAALTAADLGNAQRAALWRERVDALQQLVGIETSNRLYAARGQSFDAALVRID